MTYHRLKQTDFDGNSISFNPVSINTEHEVNNFLLFGIQPNPFSHSFRISFYNPEEANLTLEICSSTGVCMHRQDINAGAGKVEYTIDHLQKLACGFYILKILNKNSVLETKKVVKY
ncbi:hypothetical protein BH11BAC2_BH11BAC2_17610 [soil metagenome]